MSIAAVAHHRHMLSDTPYNLWLRDGLADELQIPHDGTRVEIIGGEIVVSPGPDYAHNRTVRDIQESLFMGKVTNPAFPWRSVHTQDVNLSDIHDGYIPDLCVVDVEQDEQANAERLKKLRPHQIGLVVEVTSPSNAADDRRPGKKRVTPTKWNGYARVSIPYYLLVDRDPRTARITLFSEPNTAKGDYDSAVHWTFGETVKLPKPLGFDIPTGEWETWD
ncbi:Uma2 family endonuclease [Spirillospora sp. CA-294931]|uniref:Uma2 family endonuclease n=1 Tax=Spirillospora sp. CA-294931 TaxID=3240042 RepID=UPI003D8D42DE